MFAHSYDIEEVGVTKYSVKHPMRYTVDYSSVTLWKRAAARFYGVILFFQNLGEKLKDDRIFCKGDGHTFGGHLNLFCSYVYICQSEWGIPMRASVVHGISHSFNSAKYMEGPALFQNGHTLKLLQKAKIWTSNVDLGWMKFLKTCLIWREDILGRSNNFWIYEDTQKMFVIYGRFRIGSAAPCAKSLRTGRSVESECYGIALYLVCRHYFFSNFLMYWSPSRLPINTNCFMQNKQSPFR